VTSTPTPSPVPKVRRVARWLRHLPDRWMHPLRRRRAVQALLRRERPKGSLVICHGNICRSPYAAAVLQRRLEAMGGSAMRVESAGFIAPGRPPPAMALEVAASRGYDLATHRSQLIGETGPPVHDVILVMTAAQRRQVRRHPVTGRATVLLLGDFDPAPIATRSIVDPVDRPRPFFEAIYDRIDRCAATVVALVESSRTPPGKSAGFIM
jgi:protein-tyrosine phosphatase